MPSKKFSPQPASGTGNQNVNGNVNYGFRGDEPEVPYNGVFTLPQGFPYEMERVNPEFQNDLPPPDYETDNVKGNVNYGYNDDEPDVARNGINTLPQGSRYENGKENSAFQHDLPSGYVPAVSKDVNSKATVVDDVPEDEDGEERQQWSNPIEFLLSCISMSVGLGNVWRFPMTAYENGGGAFLIPYLIVLTFIGRPLYFLELAVGQFSSLGSVKFWKAVPAVKGVGYGQMIGTWSVVTYYCSLMCLCVFYFIMSFKAVLPWAYCDPEWADENCTDASGNFSEFGNNSQSSSEQYFYHYVLRIKDNIDDGIGAPDWRLSLCLLFSWIIVLLTLVKGVESSGKVAYFTALFPYVVLITLLIRGATLTGASDGVMYFITPQWEKLRDLKVWYAAVTQSFFSLSVGFGAIITFGSYNGFKQTIYRDAWIISLADTLTSLLAGFTIFCILGNSAYELGVPIEKVVRGGSGLAFISYPDALSKFDVVPQLFAVLFFLMMFTLGVGSASALTNNIITVAADQFPHIRKVYITFAICIASFLIGLVYVTPGGQWIVDLVDYFGGGFIIFVLVILETIGIAWLYGIRCILRDIKFMLGIDLGIYWKFCWFLFIPIALTAILLYVLVLMEPLTFNKKPYPDVAYGLGWALAAFALMMVPVFFCHAVYITKGNSFREKLVNVFKPKETWGPAKRSIKREWLKYCSGDHPDLINPPTSKRKNIFKKICCKGNK